jgi:nucleoside-diphosphate-sugar epimerase
VARRTSDGGVDLTRDELTPRLERHGSEVVVHCAALVPTNPDHPDTPDSAAGTAAVDATVFRAALATGARVVYLSTCGLYDPRTLEPKSEVSRVVPRSPYFSAKLAGEQLFGRLPGTTVLRLSGPVASGMRPHLVLPRFVAAALRGETLTLWGSGSREQDFIAVDDIARLVRLVVDDPAASGIYNAASGRPITMRALADLVVATVRSGAVALADRADPLDGETARYLVEKAGGLGWVPRTRTEQLVQEVAAGTATAEPITSRTEQ